jgi:hypothetical protein
VSEVSDDVPTHTRQVHEAPVVTVIRDWISMLVER